MKYIFIITLSVALAGCQSKNRIFSENQELSPQVEWLKNDVKTFSIPVQETAPSYSLSIAFRYTEGITSKSIKVKVVEISPSKKEVTNIYDLQIIDENGEYIGEPALSIFDSEHLVEANKKYFEKGTYTYNISHDMPVEALSMAMEIGMLLDKN